MKLFDGTGFLLHRSNARIITAYLRGAYRLPLSYNRDRKHLCPRVTVHFSELLVPPKFDQCSATDARSRLSDWLRDRMLEQRLQTETAFAPSTVPEAIVASARERPGGLAVEDTTQRLTFRRLLQAAALLAVPLRTTLLPATPRVGVLLPNIAATPVTLLSLWSLGRVPACSTSRTARNPARVRSARRTQTSHHLAGVCGKARLKLDLLTAAGVQFIYLEEVRARIGAARKLGAWSGLVRLPRPALRDPQATASSSSPAARKACRRASS